MSKSRLTVLVTGANGLLGREIELYYNSLKREEQERYSLLFTTKEQLSILDEERVANFIEEKQVEVVINCAAYTAVDRAEGEEELAYLINGEGVANLAKGVERRGALLIHLSTDYLFDGESSLPYREEDITAPQTIYGKSKLRGEQLLISSGANYTIVRSSWLYSHHSINFVTKIVAAAVEREELEVVFDQVGSPTAAEDLVKALFLIVEEYREKLPLGEGEGVRLGEGEGGYNSSIYHFSNEGVASWYDFALEVVKGANLECRVKPVRSDTFPTAAKRPSYSLLDKGKFKSHFGVEIPHWRSSLLKVLDKMSGSGFKK